VVAITVPGTIIVCHYGSCTIIVCHYGSGTIIVCHYSSGTNVAITVQVLLWLPLRFGYYIVCHYGSGTMVCHWFVTYGLPLRFVYYYSFITVH
jgi:hypothetical protein